jgi:hypothetical protein
VHEPVDRADLLSDARSEGGCGSGIREVAEVVGVRGDRGESLCIRTDCDDRVTGIRQG